MKNIIYLTLAVLTVNCVLAQTNTPQREWKITLKVSDENGNPVAGAKVGVGYYTDSKPAAIDGITDTNGIFIARHSVEPSVLGYDLGFGADKDGYYSANQQQLLPPTYDPAKWNQTITLTLKRISKPIAMYAKWVSSEPSIFKKTGRPPIAFTNTAGFDFMVGDWVAPYGKGAHTDIIFTEEFNKKSLTDHFYKLTVSFPDNEDGIQPFVPTEVDKASAKAGGLLSSHEAPAEGYQSQFVEIQSSDPNRNYFFRVRTVLDPNGNIVSAHYGKIYGDFMQFTYYLNPTPNDRNIEFNPKQNLLQGLQSFEQVRQP